MTALPETILDIADLAPAAKNGDYPAAKRVLDVDGATIVAFTFAKGQVLTDHHAPHPITVQTISGDVASIVCAEPPARSATWPSSTSPVVWPVPCWSCASSPTP